MNKEHFNAEIGKKMKIAREKKGYSLRQVGELTGKNYSTIHSYEQGRRSINVDVMKEICELYGVNYLELLTEIYYEEKLRNKL